jgi:hypothetical protein
MRTQTPLQTWARHLAGPVNGAMQPPKTALTPAEATRVQRYRDQLMDALRAQDRSALRSAKQKVLEAAFCPREACDDQAGPVADSPAVRRALRDLSWRMAAVLLVRGPGH